MSSNEEDWLDIASNCDCLIDIQKFSESYKAYINPADLKSSNSQPVSNSNTIVESGDLCDVYLPSHSYEASSGSIHGRVQHFMLKTGVELEVVKNVDWQIREYSFKKILESIDSRVKSQAIPTLESTDVKPLNFDAVFSWSKADLIPRFENPHNSSLQFMVATSISVSMSGVMGHPLEFRAVSMEYLCHSVIQLLSLAFTTTKTIGNESK